MATEPMSVEQADAIIDRVLTDGSQARASDVVALYNEVMRLRAQVDVLRKRWRPSHGGDLYDAGKDRRRR